MPSIIPSFGYDIFISYRHNDNRSGWVTEFVKSLEEELAATIKDPITIYFDQNPHDGLLETHNVDKSLEGKLKSVIFIPVISQTYCDPKSFAWQHEFCAFNKLSKENPLGRDLRLINGNVASRILPIKIHDLDAEDKALLESELGGPLRAVEFIFKSAGVNRPLRKIEDHPQDNLNKTFYRDQVNKIANAIKEIITSLRSPSPNLTSSNSSWQQSVDPVPKTSQRKTLLISILVLLISSVGYFIYRQRTPDHQQLASLEKSIAVLPFIDLSELKDQGWFSDGLTEEILNSLAHVNGLNIISRTSSFAFKNKSLRIQTIADSLGVNYVVEGSVRKSNAGLRITAQLIRANDGFHIWSSTYDRLPKDILALQEEIATKIAESLDISLDPHARQQMQSTGTTNPEAFLAFLKGQELHEKAHDIRNLMLQYLKQSNESFEEAIRLDPDFVTPRIYHADFYFHYLLRSERTTYKDTMTDAQAYQLMTRDLQSTIEKSRTDVERDYYRLYRIMYSNDWSGMKPVIERVLQNPDAARLFAHQAFNLGSVLIGLGYGEQISGISLEILKNDPLNSATKRDIIHALIFAGNYREAIQYADSMNTNNQDPLLNYGKIFSLYQLGKVEESYRILKQMDSTMVRDYNSMLALMLNKMNKSGEAKAVMDRDTRIDYSLFGIEAAYGRAAANEEAHRLDKKLVMDQVLLYSYLNSPKHLPFDLSAAPNFAKRFRQAGVDISTK